MFEICSKHPLKYTIFVNIKKMTNGQTVSNRLNGNPDTTALMWQLHCSKNTLPERESRIIQIVHFFLVVMAIAMALEKSFWRTNDLTLIELKFNNDYWLNLKYFQKYLNFNYSINKTKWIIVTVIFLKIKCTFVQTNIGWQYWPRTNY